MGALPIKEVVTFGGVENYRPIFWPIDTGVKAALKYFSLEGLSVAKWSDKTLTNMDQNLMIESDDRGHHLWLHPFPIGPIDVYSGGPVTEEE